MSRVDEAHLCFGHIALECLGARRQEERIVLAPYGQEARMVFPEVSLESGIERYIALVVQKQIQLNIGNTLASEIVVVQRDAIRRHQGFFDYTVDVLPTGGARRQEGTKCFAILIRGVFPIGLYGIPSLTQSFFVGVAVLRDDAGDALGMFDGNAETGRCAVVEYINCKTIEAHDFGKAIDNVGDVIEGVLELVARRHIGATKTGQVRRDDVKVVTEQGNEIAKHVAGRREAMKQ